METLTAAKFRFANFEMDCSRRLLTRDGESLNLNAKTFDLLQQLVENHGKLVSKDELLERVWPGQFVEENNLTVQISTLRKVFGESNGASRYIATVPGKGYSFVALVEIDDDREIVIEHRTIERITVDEEHAENDLPPKQLAGKVSNRRLAFVAAAVVVVAVIGLFGYRYLAEWNSPKINSIAVLPFTYQGDRADSEFLSDGVTESLINNLAQLPNLSVKARSSVFGYKGQDVSPKKVAADLGVQAVMVGKIIESGDDFAISFEVVNASTGDQIWGERFVRKRGEIATLSNDIARDVVSKLRLKLSAEPIARGQTKDAEAYEAYLKGRYFWNKRTKADHERALALFRQAINRDPNFALAYAAISDVYSVDSSPLPREQSDPLAREAAMTALSIEPNLGEAYATLGNLEWGERNWKEGEKNYRKSIELNPNYATAHHWLAEMLCRIGRADESIAEIDTALRLEPVSQSINDDRGYILGMAHRYEEALAQAKRTHELDSSFRIYGLSYAYEYLERYDEALDVMVNHPPDRSTDPLKMADHNREIEKIRARYHKEGKQGYWAGYLNWTLDQIAHGDDDGGQNLGLSICYTNMDETKKALDYLEISVAKHESGSDMILVEPNFNPIRSEPRFQALLAKLNLSPLK